VSSSAAQPVAITDGTVRVTGLLCGPARPLACYVLAHGAGAGMAHPFMAAMASGLAERHVATLRYQFPYMEKGSRRPDPPLLAQATVRAAVTEAARLLRTPAANWLYVIGRLKPGTSVPAPGAPYITCVQCSGSDRHEPASRAIWIDASSLTPRHQTGPPLLDSRSGAEPAPA